MSVILNEKEYVEEPLLRQLEVLGWTVIRAGETGKYDPEITLRESQSSPKLQAGEAKVLPHILFH